ncbi:MAG: glycoside hydrolase family 76 protein [Phocaeicola sp.]
MRKQINLLVASLLFIALLGCTAKEKQRKNPNLERAKATLESLFENYGISGSYLLRENYPFDSIYTPTYLALEEEAVPNQFSYLWPCSGVFSAVNAIMEASPEEFSTYKTLLDEQVLPGLESYYDDKRLPAAYASYINEAPPSERFYDDNVWLGIDFVDAYLLTGEEKYLEKSKTIWKFVVSGMDYQLGGGACWCEQGKESKNCCSNAPGSVYALKLFKATNDSLYFREGKFLYEWTRTHLQDNSDYLYHDNVAIDGNIGKAKYAYSSGLMLQGAVLLYQLTGNRKYLEEAKKIAEACYHYFFIDYTSPTGNRFKQIKKQDIWFVAVMLRGFIELYRIDKNRLYLDSFNKSLEYAWDYARDENGLYNVDFSGNEKDAQKWLLTQAAIVEMYGRLATIFR